MMIEVIPDTRAAYNLFHEGTLALSKIEQNGMKVDVDYIEKEIKNITTEIESLKNDIHDSPEVKNWNKHNRGKVINIDSGPQLSDALFKYSNHKSIKKTAKGKHSTDEEALKSLKIPVVEKILRARKLTKSKSTYLGNFLREQVDGWLRPVFNLHFVKSYRSSSDSPNFQNIPVRDPEIKKQCRQAIVSRPGYMLGEIDYSGAEVKCAYTYHHDPTMYKDLTDSKRDMHRDMAMECYILGDDEWTKETRWWGKSGFVFPQFYGDYYVNCANNMWNAISTDKLKTKQQVPLRHHLRQKGIKNITHFIHHVKKVEHNFWGRRYKVYHQWKDEWFDNYQKTGYISLHSGFKCAGIMNKKEAVNYPVQGFAFHWLLWSLIELQKRIEARKLKTKIIGQIHDSIVLDIWPPELSLIIKLANKIMTKDIRKFWPVITIPLGIEIEVSPVNGSWYLKKEILKTKNICRCGNEWLYQKKVQASKTIVFECPICGRREEKKTF